MTFSKKTLENFTKELASSAPVPGGGGAAALVSAIGISLGNMVGELTVGKKKYQYVEAELRSCMEEAEKFREEFLSLIDADAEAFKPLAEAYGFRKEEPGRDELLEKALVTAAEAPLNLMRTCAKAMELIKIFAEKGSILVKSDALCAAVFIKAALQAASSNVYINTGMMKQRDRALSMEEECDSLLSDYTAMADEIHETTLNMIRKK